MEAYDLQKDYKSDPKIRIGKIKNICKYCGAKKWPAESLGLCCLGGKINLQYKIFLHRIAQVSIIRRILQQQNTSEET